MQVGYPPVIGGKKAISLASVIDASKFVNSWLIATRKEPKSENTSE
jgi:hypothetical protein